MVQSFRSLLNANSGYAEAQKGREISIVPSEALVVITCMDARIEPMQIFGLDLGQINVLRNAGGRVTEDVIRSLVVSRKLLGTGRIIVMHHTQCGLSAISEERLNELVAGNLDPSDRLGDQWANQESSGCGCGESRDYLTFSDLHQSVRDDVQKLIDSPYIASTVEILGVIYDVATKQVIEVPGAHRFLEVTADQPARLV